MIKIILVDDHKIFRESLRRLLTSEGIAEIVAEAANGKEFLEVLETIQPDLVLLDISMPVMDGIEAATLAIKKFPDLCILTLSSFGDEKYYYKMIEAGVKGFVLKSSGLTELENAINEVVPGGNWFSNELLKNIISSLSKKNSQPKMAELTERELEILKLICKGLTNEQIAEEIHLSFDTVKWHRANILSKTQCTNTALLVMYAIKNELIEV
jgi:DNA-binding NarL/FixJ family response regulator